MYREHPSACVCVESAHPRCDKTWVPVRRPSFRPASLEPKTRSSMQGIKNGVYKIRPPKTGLPGLDLQKRRP
eukprot:2803250-Prymnesium_polylepis.1